MRKVEVEFTDAEHGALREAARRESLCVEDWVVLAAIGMMAGRHTVGARSPRRDPGARAPRHVDGMVQCPHCGIITRRVHLCDNCDRVLP